MRVRIRLPDGTRPGFEVPSAERGGALKALGAALVEANVDAPRATRILRDASQADAPEFARFEALAAELSKGKAKPKPSRNDPTFAQLATRWTSGELARQFPDHVRVKRSADDDAARFARLNKTIGDVPISAFKLEHAQRAMAALSKDFSSANRRQYAQAIARLLKLAAYPLQLIPASPLPSGFLPRAASTKAKSYLYPSEDAALLAGSAPLERRLLYGFLAREGMRLGEALALQWRDLDLDRGAIKLDDNKTDDPRAWALSSDVARALAKVRPKGAAPSALVFPAERDPSAAARVFRSDLDAAGVKRPELFEASAKRMAIRIHDLRGTFVTLALASGKTETWVADRTGHKSSAMINRYRRAARSAAELELGWLSPLDSALGLSENPPSPPSGPNSGPSPSRGTSESASNLSQSHIKAEVAEWQTQRIQNPPR